MQEEVDGLKNKIKKFSKGDFQLAQPQVVFPDTSLILTIGEGEVYKGYFMIKNRGEGSIRGLVYSSSFRMRCLEQGFEGNPVRVEFEYDGRGLLPGHVEQGTFTVVCTGGEYTIPFTALIEKPYVMTNYGKVQNTDDFRRLAVKDYTEALKLFRSREFYEVLKYEDKRIFYLYDNMRKWSLDEAAMEEFLVGIKQKECIFLTLPGEGMLFQDVKEITKQTLTVIKNTWGYMPVQIQTEGEFLSVSRNRFTTDDFVGNVYQVDFLVKPDGLHAGRNFGKIHLITPYEILSYDVEVMQNGSYDENHREIEFLMAQVVKEHVSCVAGRMTLDKWTESAVDKVKKMRQIDPLDEYLQLFQAHVYIHGNQIEDAKWILENYNYNRFAIGKNPKVNAYYLYLTALVRGHGSHMDRVIDEVGKIYLRQQDSTMLLLMLLDIDPQYRDKGRRLAALEQHYQNYRTNGVLFLLEAFQCYEEKSLLLKKLGQFEMMVLNFASKYRLISREMAMYVANLASQQKNYSEFLFHILERLYKLYAEPMILNAICTLLIKGNKLDNRYFVWYQRAVNEGFKIAQLYEYYMSTIEEDDVREALPKSIFLYFMHGNTLNYKKAALLYANLITYEENASDLYISYREQMVAFAWEQLMKRHITESLKVIYKKFCTEEEMTGERLEAMRDICHAYLVKTKVHNLKCALVIEKDGTVKQRIPYRPDGMIVYLYDKEARIIWQTMDGGYHTDSIAFETKRLFYEPRYLEMCKKYMSRISNWGAENNKLEVNFENIRKNGIRAFDEKEVFRLCSKTIREEDYDEDEFMLYLSYELFKRQQYDKMTLTYLADYYCGSTRNMKVLWKVAKDYGIAVTKLGERIITQMLFSEDMFAEEDIFIDYYLNGNPYFRLKQAYLAYVSREYVVYGRSVGASIFDIIMNEEKNDEDLADICKVALLKRFAGKEYGEEEGENLHRFLREMCERQLVFPFYMEYEESWLREAQIYDKTMVSFQASHGGRVRITYKMRRGDVEDLGYQTESLMPVYENIYVKSFVLFQDEQVRYSFCETSGKKSYTDPEEVLKQERKVPEIGKYGKLNAMAGMAPARKKQAMIEYEQEAYLAERIFGKTGSRR